MPEKPVLYVIAGTNGTGKSSHYYAFLPVKIPVINTDAIARQLNEKSVSEAELYAIANEEGNKLVQQYLKENKSFGIETNLADNGSWKMIFDIQKQGYAVQIFYFGVEDLGLSIKRIAERVFRGEHHVPANLVKERFLNSVSLLNHYFDKPDLIVFIDNTSVPEKIAVLANGKVSFRLKKIHKWIEENFGMVLNQPTKDTPAEKAQNASSIEAVKLLYSKMKNKKP
jgi:predicted ABC-type ATPase